MPRIATAKDILESSADMPLECVVGTITEVYKSRSGTKNDKDWFFQDFKIKVGKEIIKGTTCKELPANCKNKEVIFTAKHGQKGWTGLYTKDDEYKGRTTRIIWVTGTCEIELADGSRERSESSDSDDRGNERPDREQREEPREQPDTRQGQQRSTQSRNTPAALTKNHEMAIKDLKQALPVISQVKNLYLMAIYTAGKTAMEAEQIGCQFSTEQMQACISTLFIEFSRKTLSPLMPTHHNPIDLINELKAAKPSGQGE